MKLIFTILLSIFITFNLNGTELQKAKIYQSKHNISNWLMSEKLDGIRTYWNGKELLSKNGNKIYAPSWFTKDFPSFELDGELWTKRADFENIQNIVLDKTPTKYWKEITYNIFEVPNEKGNFRKRLMKIQKWLEKNQNKYIKVIPQIKCKNKKHLDEYLEELINLKAEGVMIKNPEISYFKGRSSQILKVKKFHDMEGEIIGFNFKGNRLKSLRIKLDSNIVFNLGGGFTKKQRETNDFKIGDFVTFKYYSFTKYGKPKFASFLRVRKMNDLI